MELINRSNWHTGFVNTVIGPEDELMGAVLARPCYRLVNGGLAPLEAGEEHPFPVASEPLETPYGSLDSAQVFCRQDVDLIVCGRVHAPRREPREVVGLTLQVGDFAQRFLAWGDRRWCKRQGKWYAGKPEPFTSLPLDASRAYGGKALTELGEFPFALNPEGRGFVPEGGDPSGVFLPNIEDSEHPIQTPEDRPEPCFLGPCGQQSFLRIQNGIELGTDPSTGRPQITRLKPSLYNNAHPGLIVPSGQTVPGKKVRIDALSPEGAFCFVIPDHPMHLHVQLQDRHHLFPFHLEEIIVFSDENKVSFGYRCAFRYKVEAMEKRAAVVYDGLAPERTPRSYALQWNEWTGDVLP
jgi:hypothetical protein